MVEDVRVCSVATESALPDYFCDLADEGILDLEKTNKLLKVL